MVINVILGLNKTISQFGKMCLFAINLLSTGMKMSLAIASLNRYHTDAYASAGKESITQTSEPQYSHNPTRVQ